MHCARFNAGDVGLRGSSCVSKLPLRQSFLCSGQFQDVARQPFVVARCRGSRFRHTSTIQHRISCPRSVAQAAAGSAGGAFWKLFLAILSLPSFSKLLDPVLGVDPDPVFVLGIDETRRGKPKWVTDPVTGLRRWVDPFDTGFVGISGNQGLLAQVNGRDAKAVVGWLDGCGAAFKAGITHVAIDMSASYAKAIREALPHAKIVVDRFHLVRLAKEMVDEVRRRTTQELRGRRGRKADPEWLSRRRLLREAERLTAQQRQNLFDKVMDLDVNGDVAAAWIAKELLRDVLACKDNGGLRYEIWRRLDEFYTFAARCSTPEIHRLATTVDTWQEPMITAIETNLSNAKSEGENRIVNPIAATPHSDGSMIGRIAFGFRNQDNQRRRVRWACTRQTRPVPSRVKRLRPC
ncbi:ISL3 family transposase [Nakamurella antarctica]|uniref:ISL3 family transposase n=1 Tax=Nakamurella antarctica TaxID=1902245 RepID=A0A3G8ZZ21_9ACTN|nr:ISL3 family transposase [Nakamurella antarctica]